MVDFVYVVTMFENKAKQSNTYYSKKKKRLCLIQFLIYVQNYLYNCIVTAYVVYRIDKPMYVIERFIILNILCKLNFGED